MATTKKKAPKVPDRGILPATNVHDIPSIYINNAEVLSAGDFDVRLGLNEILVENGIFQAVRRANVVMSTPSFFLLLNGLQGIAQQIQAQHKARADAGNVVSTKP